MARPFKNEAMKRQDRIIAKVHEQLYRWGFSSSVIESLLPKAAYDVLRRGNVKQKDIGNVEFMSDEDQLSKHSVEKIYKTWNKEAQPYFSRLNYPKSFLNGTAPKQEHLYEVVCFFMEYMNQEPEKCIFKEPPQCPDEMIHKGIWWRFYNGELDGDPELNPKAEKRSNTFPELKITRKK